MQRQLAEAGKELAWCRELEAVLAREQQDVERLENISLVDLLAMLLGTEDVEEKYRRAL